MEVVIPLNYVDKLQRENADDLAFYPLTTIEKAMADGQVIACYENDEPAGYLWFGAMRGGRDVTIYQACVDYDLRRQNLGFGMVADLIQRAKVSGSTGIRLKCASSAESNRFWQAAGFYCTAVTPGGIKRGRDLNHYRTDVQVPLLLAPQVEPSAKPINLTRYHELKRSKTAMPSRFSRSHYGGLLVVGEE